MKKLGVYIHIPFCIRKCKYCGFVSFDNCNRDVIDRYCDALVREIELKAADYSGYEVDTVFIGGGTPSMIPGEKIANILECVKNKFNMSDNQEITIEANPGTLTAEKLEIYRKSGINRLSIGVQSMNDDVLKVIGRIHDRKEVLDTYEKARKCGFDNINFDLMFSLPCQTDEIWEETLREAIALKPEHISFYSLQIEEGTEFYEMYKRGELDIADDDTDRDRYHKAVGMLKNAGYNHYEISNAAFSGLESKHNMKYWSMDEYLGLGLAAHSFTGGRRFYNTSDISEYLNAFETEGSGASAVILDEICSRDDLIFEYVFTGLRKTEGISLDDYRERFGIAFSEYYKSKIPYITEQVKQEFMFTVPDDDSFDFKSGRLGLTLLGIDVSNSIMSEFAERD